MTDYTTEDPTTPVYTSDDAPTNPVEANISLQERDGVYFFVRSSLYDLGAGLVLNEDDNVYYVNTGSLPRGLKMRIEGNSVVMET